MDTNGKKGNALKASIICLVLGCLIMAFTAGLFIIYIPLFFASFVLSIVAMTQNNILGGILVLIGNFILPFIIFAVLISIGMNEFSDTENLFTDDLTDETTEQVETSKLDYVDQIRLYDFKAKYYTTFLEERVAGVDFKLENKGDSTLKSVTVTVFFKDSDDRVIHEKDFTPFYVSNSEFNFDPDKPLKPNYIWQNEENQFLKADNVPDEWQEGNASIEITDVDFVN